MKTFVVLAIVVSLISVQGSSVNEDVYENDYVFANDHHDSSADDSDAINDGKFEEEFQGREMLWDDRGVVREPALKCLNNVCSLCKGIYCLNVGYLAEKNSFLVAFTKHSTPFQTQIIEAVDWNQCMQLDIVGKVAEACVRIEDVKIEDGHACIDLTINSEFMEKSVSNVCM